MNIQLAQCIVDLINLQGRLWYILFPECRYDPDQPRDDHGRWTNTGGGSSQDTSESQLTKPTESGIIPVGKDGRKFRFPSVDVGDAYGYFIHGVNSNYYDRYEGKSLCAYYSGKADMTFYFENHGYDDYNIYDYDLGIHGISTIGR